MGTNFYLHQQPKQPCPTCGHADNDDPLHIGKSSGGWCFSLHIIPELGIRDLPDWERLWAQPGAVIREEYGQTLTPEEMRLRITDRSLSAPPPREGAFYERNHAQEGPNGLIRHRLDWHCTAHGEGTWDCIVGEFS